MYDPRIFKQLSNQAFFAVLNSLDYLTTHILITTDGQELMPVGASVIENYGMPGLFLFKTSLTLVIICIGKLARFKDTLWDLLNGALTAVVVWNSLGIFLSMFFPV